MKILHLSDTHGKHDLLTNLPEADIIVHSGDFTFSGSEQEAYDFMNWFCDLPYAHKIFIAGNHDDCLYGADTIEGLPENVHYLCNSGITLSGLHFYGIPMFMQDELDGLASTFFARIPDNTDILITHQPPFDILDTCQSDTRKIRYGNIDLRTRIDQLHLRCHLFGHQHEANATLVEKSTLFSNAALLDNHYKLIAKPRIIKL